MEEAPLKAEFIERFLQFVEWPGTGEDTPESRPLVVGVFGDSDVAIQLRHISKVTTGGRSRRTRFIGITNVAEAADCNVVFIAESRKDQLRAVLAVVKDRPILTISDRPGYGSAGVMINFYREGDYLRFEINQHAVDRSGLRFSSQLLRLARLVEEPDR